MNTLQQIRRYIYACPREKNLLWVAVVALALLIVAEIRFPIWVASPAWLGEFLTSNALKSIISSVSASVFAAYVFYVFIELIPASAKRSETLKDLDALLFVVLDSFNDRSLGGPFIPLSDAVHFAQRRDGCLTMEFIEQIENKNRQLYGGNYQGNGLSPLEQISEAAEFRMPALSFAVQLAYSISSKHGLVWLDILKGLHELSLESAHTMVNMTNEERRSIVLMTTTWHVKTWLNTR